MRFPVYASLLVTVKGTGPIPLRIAWGHTGVPRVHCLGALEMTVGVMRVVVREAFVRKTIANTITVPMVDRRYSVTS